MKRKTNPEAARAAAMHRWQHTALYGRVRMAEANMRSIRYSPSTTPEARAIAREIELLCPALLSALATRID